MRKSTSIVFSSLAILALSAGPALAETIKIGVIQPLTGSVAFPGTTFVEGAKMAAEKINKHGGVLGKQIELVIEDGQCKGANSVSAAEKLIVKDKVPVLIGSFCSGATVTVMPVAEKYKIPLVTGVSSRADLTEKGNIWFFRVTETDALLAKAFAKILYNNLNLKRLAYLGVNDDWGRGAVEAFVKNIEALGGKTVLADYFEHGTTDFYTLLTKIRAAKPDGLFVAAETQDGAILVKQIKELGIDTKVFGVGSWATSKFVDLAGEAAEGLHAAVPYAETMPNALNQAFVKAYKAKYNHSPGKYSAAGHRVVHIVAQAIERAGAAEPAKIRDALEKTDYRAVNGRFQFDDKHQAYGFDLVLVRLQKGVPVVLSSASVDKP